jgi:nucleoside-diphosphate-sugar epimerase
MMIGDDAGPCAKLPDRRCEGKSEGSQEKEKTTMRVAVTGGRGRLGGYVVAALRSDRHAVRVVDRTQPDESADWPAVDMLDRQAVETALRGQEAVVHLAAIDSSLGAPAETTFEVNVRGTWNVFQAAESAGLRRVVLCSSSVVTGLVDDGLTPLYLPIDEAYPVCPRGTYALTKVIGEQIAAAFARNGKLEVVVLRPPYVAFPETLRFLAGGAPDIAGRAVERRPQMRGYVGPEDAARGFALALTADCAGEAPFWLVAADSFIAEPTLDYLRAVYGTVPELRDPALYRRNPRASPFDLTRTQRRLGWTPTTSWPALLREAGLEDER